MKYNIGIDIGGTNISFGLVTETGKITEKISVRTFVNKEKELPDITINRIITTLKKFLGDNGSPEINNIGIGCPGTCSNKTGVVEFANNLGWKNVAVKKEFEQAFGVQTFIDNDANAAAFGEFIAGSAKGKNSAVILTLGTGVGSGIIIGGKIFRGTDCAGGEIGHTVIETDGIECACGRKGCFESYASATALIRMTKKTIELTQSKGLKEIVSKFGKISARTAFDAERAGDAQAKEIVEKYIRYLSCGITNVINVFKPEILCVGGGICNEGENLLGRIREKVYKEIYSKLNPPEIVQCSLGNDAGIVGAAMLCKE